MKYKIVTLFIITLFCCGVIKAELADSLTLKVALPTHSFAGKSRLIITNNYSIQILMKFYVNHMREHTGPDERRETFLHLKVLNISSNKVEEINYPLFLDDEFGHSLGNAIGVKPGGTIEIPIDLTIEYFDFSRYEILDLYANLSYYYQFESDNTNSRYFGHPVRPIEIDCTAKELR